MAEQSLFVSLLARSARVRLQAEPQYVDELRRIAPRFGGVRQPHPGVAEIELDDFLSNISKLQSWSAPSSVVWADDVRRLVETSITDAATVDRILASGEVNAVDTAAAFDLGELWIGALTDFQLRDLRKLASLNHSANFSVPGAGKTRVALALYSAMRERGDVRRLLLVGPKSSYEAWTNELDICFSSKPKLQVFDREIAPWTEVLMVNYERLEASREMLTEWLSELPSMLVLDEAHRMKLGAQGTYGSACLSLGPLAVRRLILTGTPAPNGVADLENLMSFVWPGRGRQAVTRSVAGGDLRRASASLRPLFTRTTKEELGLPPQNPVIHRIEMPPAHREVYDALIGQASARAMGSKDDIAALGKISMYLLMAATSPALLSVGTTKYEPLSYRVPPLSIPIGTELFQLMRDLPSYEVSPKYAAVTKIVDDNAKLGRKTIVWSTFVRSLTTLHRLLAPYHPSMVHGGTTDRGEQISRFRNDPDAMVLLSNPATLGEGISLHRDCQDAIYVDRDFAAGRFLQSLDRIHRLGLPEGSTTRVTVLSSRGTIDEVVEQRLDLKLNFMAKILDDKDLELLGDLDEEPDVAGGLTSEDVRALLSHLNVHSV